MFVVYGHVSNSAICNDFKNMFQRDKDRMPCSFFFVTRLYLYQKKTYFVKFDVR